MVIDIQKNLMNKLSTNEMNDIRANIILEITMLFSGIGTFFFANMELIGAVIVGAVTFVTSWYFRIRKHKNEIMLMEEKFKIEIKQARAKLSQEESKHIQEMQQDEERHKLELELMRLKFEETKK